MLLGKKKKNSVNPEGQMELVEHLTELRVRLFRSIACVVVGMVATYSFFPEIFELLWHPIRPLIEKLGGKIVFPNATDAFLLRLQISFLSGFAVAFPFVTLELWGFIAPALTPQERKPIFFLAPFSVLLFLSGVGTAYASLPAAFAWMLSFVADVEGATLYQNPQQYILLTVKILLSFGIAFQLPIILLFLARVGIIDADFMTKYWRQAIVLIAGLAAVLTPSNDPLTMLMMAIPMAGLYGLSIGMVRAFSPRADGSRTPSFVAMLLVALAPVGLLAAVGYWLWRMG